MSVSMSARARRSGVALAVVTATIGAGAVAAPSMAASGTGVQSRAQVPWSSVGKGWVVADVAKGGHTNLVLVSPGGQSYQIGTIDGAHLADVSSDARRVLLYSDSGAARTMDLRTGKTLTDLPFLSSPSFTKPSGAAVIGTDGYGRLKNYSATTGRANVSGVTLKKSLWGVASNPSGTLDVLAMYDGSSGLAVYNNSTLKPVRSLPTPAGYTLCTPNQFIDDTHFRETCIAKANIDKTAWAQTTQVFTQSTNGGAPQQVTSGTYPSGWSQGIPLGFGGAWNTSKGVIASPNLATFTGSTRLFRIVGGKVAQTYNVPMSGDVARMTPMVKTMVGNSAYFTTNLHEPGPSIAVRYDVATGKVNYLAGPRSQYGGTVHDYAVVQ